MKRRLFLVIGLFFFLFSQAIAQPLPEIKDTDMTGKIDIRVGSAGIFLHAENAELKQVFAELSLKTGVALTAGPQIDGKISLEMKGEDLEEILKKICASRAVVYTLDPETGVYMIVSGHGFDSVQDNTTSEIKIGRTIPVLPEALETPQAKTDKIETVQVPGLFVEKKMYDHKGRLLYKPGELLLKLKKNILPADIQNLHTTLGSRVLETIKSLRLQKIRLKKAWTKMRLQSCICSRVL